MSDFIFAQLREPFPVDLIKWRVGSTNAKKLGVKPWQATKGIALAYLNARDVMKRLDDVVGFNNWQDRYPYSGCCELSIRIDGEWITKSDSAGETDVEGVKGQSSDSFKRAAVKFGIGRYLYYLENNWVDLKDGKILKKPMLPPWAHPHSAGMEESKDFQEIVAQGSLIEFWDYWKDLTVERKIALANSFGDKRTSNVKIGKTQGKKMIREMESQAPLLWNRYLHSLEEAARTEDAAMVEELFLETTEVEQKILINNCRADVQQEIERLIK